MAFVGDVGTHYRIAFESLNHKAFVQELMGRIILVLLYETPIMAEEGGGGRRDRLIRRRRRQCSGCYPISDQLPTFTEISLVISPERNLFNPGLNYLLANLAAFDHQPDVVGVR